MNDALKMQISAFVDGELSDAEAELLTRRLGQDADLRRQAAQYLEIGQLLRGEQGLASAATLRERVAEAMQSEPLLSASPPAAGPRWMRPAAGVGIAASVALLALFGLRQVDLPDTGAAVPPDAVASGRDIGYTEPAPGAVLSDRPSDRLVQYYRSHGQSAGDLGTGGILSELVTLEQLVEVAPVGPDADDAESGGLEPDAAAGDNDASDSAQE